jgi:hypothetical protein
MHRRRRTASFIATAFVAAALAPAAADAHASAGAPSAASGVTKRKTFQTHCAVNRTAELARSIRRG